MPGATTATFFGTPNDGQAIMTAAMGGTLSAPTFGSGAAGGEIITAGTNGTRINKIVCVTVAASEAVSGYTGGSNLVYVWVLLTTGVYVLRDTIRLPAAGYDIYTELPKVERSYEKLVVPSGGGLYVSQSVALITHINAFAGNA